MVYVPTRPLPPSEEQVVLAANVAPVRGENTALAVVVITPVQGAVVEFTAPHRAAVSTDKYSRLPAQTIQAVWMIPRMNRRTGRATRPNSTAVAP